MRASSTSRLATASTTPRRSTRISISVSVAFPDVLYAFLEVKRVEPPCAQPVYERSSRITPVEPSSSVEARRLLDELRTFNCELLWCAELIQETRRSDAPPCSQQGGSESVPHHVKATAPTSETRLHILQSCAMRTGGERLNPTFREIMWDGVHRFGRPSGDTCRRSLTISAVEAG